jgi:hypothetical protein
MQAVHAIGIQHGWDIYTNDGQPLGSAKAVTDTYVLVEKGRIFKHDVYIPTSAIMEADENEHRATLSITEDEVDSMGWDQPPAGGTGGSVANDLPPATDTSVGPRPQDMAEPGADGAIDRPEPAQPSMNVEPQAIDGS